MKLFIFALAVSAVCASSFHGGVTYKPSCQKKVYCDSKLLHYVQMARIFPDSKSFVDLHMNFDENTIMRAFDDLLKDTKNEPSKAELQEFVDYFFDSESGLETWTPTDFKSEPHFLSTIRDPQLRQFAKNVNNIWPTLGRKMKPMVFEDPESFSMIPVHNGFIVPGGRFREFYYWDTYWIIEGLLISGMTETVKGMLSNFIELQRQFGHIPNGARWYYQERSQPPLLSAMMNIYLQETNDVEFLRANIDVLESELEYWLDTHSVVFEVAGKEYSLLRYYAPSVGPRPESYYEDYTNAQAFETEQRQKQFYTDIKSAAESGWDFSSRWFISKDGGNKGNLTSIHTTDIVPVDLNAIFANAVQNIAHFYDVLRDSRKGAHWLQINKRWVNTIKEVLWNEEDGIWYDWDLHNSQHRKFFYPSNIAPLWMGVVEPEFLRAKSQKILSYMKKTHSLEYPGGIPTSLIRSGEQWDFPNAWPPLVSMVVGALEALQTEESNKLAFEVAQTWVRSNYKGYLSNKQLYEKYDVESPGKVGSGGEYTAQDGFGWTNGAVLEMLAKYGPTMTAAHGYVPFHSKFPQYSSGAVSYTQSFNSPNVDVQPVHIAPPKPTPFNQQYFGSFPSQPKAPVKPTYFTSAPAKPTVFTQSTYLPAYPTKPLYVSAPKPEYVGSASVKPTFPETKPQLVQSVKPQVPETKPEYVETKPEFVSSVKPQLPENKPEYVETKPEFVSSVKPQLPETKPEYVETKPEFVSSVKPQVPETKPEYVEAKPVFVSSAKPQLPETKPEYASSVKPETKPQFDETKPEYVEAKPIFISSIKPQLPETKPEFVQSVKPQLPETKPEFVKPEYTPSYVKPEYIESPKPTSEYVSSTTFKPEYVSSYPTKPLSDSPVESKPEYISSVKPYTPFKPEPVPLNKPESASVGYTKPTYIPSIPVKPVAEFKPEVDTAVYTKPSYVVSKPEFISSTPNEPEYVPTTTAKPSKPLYVSSFETKPTYVVSVEAKPTLNKPGYGSFVQAKPEFVSSTAPVSEYVPTTTFKPEPENKHQYVATAPVKPAYITLTETKPEYAASYPAKPLYVSSAKPEFVTSAPVKPDAPVKPAYITLTETKPEYVAPSPAKPLYASTVKPDLTAPVKPAYITLTSVQTKPDFASSTLKPEEKPTFEAHVKPEYVSVVQADFVPSAEPKPEFAASYPAKPLYVSSAKPEFVTYAPAKPEFVTSAPAKPVSPVKPAYITITETKPEYVAPSPAKPLYASTAKPDLAAPVKPAYITLTSVQAKPDFASSTLKPEGKPTFEAHVKPEYVSAVQADFVPSAEPKPEYVSITNAEATVPTKEIYVQYTPTKPTFASQSLYLQTSPTKPLATPVKPSFGFPIQFASASPQVSHGESSYVQSSFVASTPSEYKPTTPFPESTEYVSSSVTEAEYTTVVPAKVEYATQAPFKPEYTTTLLDSEYSSTVAPTEFYPTTQSEHSESLTPVKTTQATQVKPGYFVSIQAKPQVNTLSINTASAEKPALSTFEPHSEKDSQFTTTYATSAPTKYPSFTEDKPSILFSTLNKPEHTHVVVVDSAAPQQAAILQQSHFTQYTPGSNGYKHPLGYLSSIPVQTFGIATAPPKTEGFSSISHITVNSTTANSPFAFTHVTGKPEYAFGTSGSGFVFNKTVTPGRVSTVEFVGTPVKTEQSVFGYSTFGKPSYLQTGQYVPSNWHSSQAKPIFGTTSKNVYFSSNPIKHTFSSGQYQPQFNTGLYRNTYVKPTVIKSVSVKPATVVA